MTNANPLDHDKRNTNWNQELKMKKETERTTQKEDNVVWYQSTYIQNWKIPTEIEAVIA